MLKRLSIKKTSIAAVIALVAFVAYQAQALISVPLEVTEIVPIQSSAISDNSYEHGWKWTFKVTVPSDETVFKMRFANWTSGEDSIPATNNIRFYTDQSITAWDADHAVEITEANVYSSALLLNESADLDSETAGRQIEVTVEAKIPRGAQNGSYATSYGIKSAAPVNLSALEAAIESAHSTRDAATEGTEPGNFTFASIATFETSIIVAEQVRDNMSSTQGEVDTAVTALNAAIAAFTPIPQIVLDTTVPQITLIGSTTVIVGQNETYTDAGATANDNIDENISANIVVTGLPVNTTTVSTSTITYTVTDAAGNSTNVIRMVIVRDITPPTIVAGDDVYATSTGEWTYVDLELPMISDASGYTKIVKSYASTSYPVGTTTITWNAEDYYGNTSSDVQLVVILESATITPPVIVTPDIQAPIITPIEFNTIIYGDEFNHTVTAEGAVVNFNLLATDNVDANVPVICTPASNILFALGNYEVTCTATDIAGNVGTYAFNLIVRDGKGPVITINGDIFKLIVVGGEYTELGATAVDQVEGPVDVTISGSVNTNAVGEYYVKYEAKDSNNFTTTSGRQINVVSAAPAPAAEVEPAPETN